MNQHKHKKSGTDYKAKYLILLADDSATRALLYGHDHRYLAEVIDDDDGMVLDNLMRAGTVCPPPGELACEALRGTPVTLQCYALA